MQKNICKKCQHEWFPRVSEVKECPKCKSRNWNEPIGNTLEILSPKPEEETEILPIEEEPSPLAVLIAELINKIWEKK